MAFLQNTAGCIFCGNPPPHPPCTARLTPSPSSPHSSLCRSLPLSRLRCRRRRRRRSHLTPLRALAALPCVPHPVAPVPGNGVLSQRPPRHLAGGGRAPRSRLGTSKVDARRRVLESVDDRVGGVVRADDVLHGDSHFLPHGRAAAGFAAAEGWDRRGHRHCAPRRRSPTVACLFSLVPQIPRALFPRHRGAPAPAAPAPTVPVPNRRRYSAERPRLPPRTPTSAPAPPVPHAPWLATAQPLPWQLCNESAGNYTESSA